MTLGLHMAEIMANQHIGAHFNNVRYGWPLRVFVKIKILKFCFLHDTQETIRYNVVKFHGPKSPNGWDYLGKPSLAQMGTRAP